MARWSLNVVTMTPAAGVADSVSAGITGIVGLVGGSTTQYIKVYELEEQGQTSSAAGSNFMLWARSSTAGTTLSALAAPNSLGPLDPNTAAMTAPAVGYVATTGSAPFRNGNIAVAKLNMSFNPFGGILRWQAAPGCEWGMLGNAAPNGETTLTNFTGGATGAQSFKALLEIL